MTRRTGILLVKKPKGVTSFSSLGTIKRLVDPKVGHCGTLDKFAEGLLIVLTGSMTKLNVLFSSMDKRYRATMRFGVETDTLDPEGNVIATAPIPDAKAIDRALPAFSGSLLQRPPQYSALHVGGKRASALARAGKVVEMQERRISVHALEPISFDGRDFVFETLVSKGTYIRSLARDIGIACGSRAHLVALTRTAIGPYGIAEAVSSENADDLLASLVRTDELLRRLDSLSLCRIPDVHCRSLANGVFPPDLSFIRHREGNTYGAVYDGQDNLRAVVDLKLRRIVMQVRPPMEEGRK